MLTIYRRHKANCQHRGEGRAWRRCQCPLWVDGVFEGQEIRQSLRVQTWEAGEDELEKLKKRLRSPGSSEGPITLVKAWEAFEADAKSRNLREATLRKYKYLRGDMERFAADKGLRFVAEFTLERLREWRSKWPNKNLGALKKLDLVRAFMRFVHDSGWTADNPARKVKAPKVRPKPTMAFEREEMVRILAALDKYSEGWNRRRMRALVLLLRYSGLRIGDAVTLACERINGDKLFLYTSKAGTPVYCPLPQVAVRALEAIAPAEGGRFYFWTGNGKVKTICTDWGEKLKALFQLAKVPSGHAHRFRDTFATELLLAGVPLERVSILLGHSSIRITERHYAPWVRARQEQLEADVRRTWILASEVSTVSAPTSNHQPN